MFCKAAGIENIACMSWKAPGMSAVQVVKEKYERQSRGGPHHQNSSTAAYVPWDKYTGMLTQGLGHCLVLPWGPGAGCHAGSWTPCPHPILGRRGQSPFQGHTGWEAGELQVATTSLGEGSWKRESCSALVGSGKGIATVWWQWKVDACCCPSPWGEATCWDALLSVCFLSCNKPVVAWHSYNCFLFSTHSWKNCCKELLIIYTWLLSPDRGWVAAWMPVVAWRHSGEMPPYYCEECSPKDNRRTKVKQE